MYIMLIMLLLQSFNVLSWWSWGFQSINAPFIIRLGPTTLKQTGYVVSTNSGGECHPEHYATTWAGIDYLANETIRERTYVST